MAYERKPRGRTSMELLISLPDPSVYLVAQERDDPWKSLWKARSLAPTWREADG